MMSSANLADERGSYIARGNSGGIAGAVHGGRHDDVCAGIALTWFPSLMMVATATPGNEAGLQLDDASCASPIAWGK